MAKVEFHFDFGSPNAYLAHLLVPQIEQRTGASFEKSFQSILDRLSHYFLTYKQAPDATSTACEVLSSAKTATTRYCSKTGPTSA